MVKCPFDFVAYRLSKRFTPKNIEESVVIIQQPPN